MNTTFDKCFTLLLGSEGGFTDDPRDRGNWTTGEIGKGNCSGTKWGIAAASYPTLNIPALTQDQAKDIYKRDFWNPLSLDNVDPEVAFQIFDAAVNHGIKRAIKLSQIALSLKDDGVVGPMTKKAILEASDLEFIIKFNSARLRYYTAIPTWSTYGKGWTNRVADNLLRLKI